MKKSLIIGSLLCSLFGSSYAYTTYPVCFTGYNVESLDVISYNYTQGYYFDPNITYSQYCLYFDAYAKLSSGTVDWVKHGLAVNNISWASHNMINTALFSNNNMPNQLDFVINANISLVNTYSGDKLTCDDIYIGQGQDSIGVNWWLFSNNNDESRTITCTVSTNGSKPRTTAVGVDRAYSYGFYLSPKN